jgi:hypothetical protein
MKNLFKAVLGTATIAIVLAANVSAKAQTIQFNAVGSSALFLEIGQAAALTPSIGASCVWSVKSSSANHAYALDSRYGTAPGTTENGNIWIAWTPVTGSCATVTAATNIYAYISTDSTVGVRCYFASPKCTVNIPVANVGLAGAGVLGSSVAEVVLPAGIQTALNGQSFNAAGTDIRPEDAKFATLRALTTCGTPVAAGSQYLGLGYQTGTTGVGSSIVSAFDTSSFHVADFNLTGTDPITSAALPGTFTVSDVGAAPVVVTVNPSDPSGFGNLLVQNVNRAILAGYLDGTYGHTSDINPAGYLAGGALSTVLIREPLSGTYNTMEYAIANRVDYQSSQDVGVIAVNANTAAQVAPLLFCTAVGGTVKSTTLNESILRTGGGSSLRQRAIGTGQALSEVRLLKNGLGYGFWSAANFGGFNGTNGKYLTVDGVDPIQEVYQGGLIPTSGNGQIGNVTLANVKNGTYPIWSKLRIVSAGGAGVTNLVAAAQNFLSPSQPDFVPAGSLSVIHSHFAPPGVNFPSTGTNVAGNGSSCGTETGGDVGGTVISSQADGDYCADNASATGQTGLRQ